MPQSLPLVWALPFAGLLLSIALVPLVAAKFWHAHYGKIGLAWALVFVLPFGYVFGRAAAMHAVAHAVVEDFVPFIAVLLALFTIAGGIWLRVRRSRASWGQPVLRCSSSGRSSPRTSIARIAPTSSCFSSCWSATSAVRFRPSAIRRCSSAS
jgi:hypothetical protein